MSVDDWIQSPRSQRIWLEDSMMALGQFAFIAPIHRVKHWNPTTKRRNNSGFTYYSSTFIFYTN